MIVDAPRLAALEILRAVRVDDAYANLVAPAMIAGRGLVGRDAAFSTELAYGALRWQGWYDTVLASCVSRPWERVDPAVQDVLRLGAHQLLAMRVPDHAAVDSSCDLARGIGDPAGGRGRAGFVNAVLRAVAARNTDGWVEELRAGRADDDLDWLAQRWSHPLWIVRALREALGARRDELTALLAADNRPARPMLAVRPGRMTVEELLALPQTAAARWSPIGATLVDGSPADLECVRAGRAGVQDEGSQLVALALGRVDVAEDRGRWLDMCAGPGGKAAILAGLAGEHGGTLVAVEQHAHRARLVSEVLGADAVVLTGDARDRPWGEGDFDRVLVDAPCSGLGALRRRPESRWRRSPSDLATLGPLQRSLLATALAAVRRGGVVAYVTCSPHLAETELVVRDVLREVSDVTVLDAATFVPQVPDCAVGPFVQLWPHRHGTDAMFCALLRRR